MTLDPSQVLNPDDPGDDTQRRFRYQNSYGAYLGILMTEDDAADMEEIYCEHHDDILIKDTKGKFAAVQIKTRDLSLRPFDIHDEAIEKSCRRFVEMDLKFPEKFKRFTILSNHGFDKTSPASCIASMIEHYVKGNAYYIRNNYGKFIKKIADACGCTCEEVIETIKKLKLYASFSTLDDIPIKLKNALRNCKTLKGITESKVNDIADLLLTKFSNAASLVKENENMAMLYIAGTANDDQVTQAEIGHKRITRNELADWFKTQKETPVVLKLKDRPGISEMPSGTELLYMKMDAGEINADNINMMRDLKYSFEQHAASWVHKDLASANERYQQVMTVTENLCREVYDEHNIATSNNGMEMLKNVRSAIKDRKANDQGIFLDCTYEHVLGTVGVLTENCKVWWSSKFEAKK